MSLNENAPMVSDSGEEVVLRSIEKIRAELEQKDRLDRKTELESAEQLALEMALRKYKSARAYIIYDILKIDNRIVDKLSGAEIAVLEKKMLGEVGKRARWAKYIPRICWSAVLFSLGGMPYFFSPELFMGTVTLFFLSVAVHPFCKASYAREYLERREYLSERGLIEEKSGLVD